MSSAPAIAGNGLACERGDRVLFEDLDVETHGGAALQVTGPNGCGKTSLLRILCGLLLPREGHVSWRGLDIERHRAALLSELCYLGYAGGVKLELTPRENLTFLSALQRRGQGTSIDEALARVGLRGFEDVPAHTLSAGQRRRVSLARLLVTAAPLWILDEPLTALDGQGTALAEMLMDEHVRGGGVLVYTTHQRLERSPTGTRVLDLAR